MNGQLTVDHKNLIKDIAVREGFNSYDLEIGSSSSKGDGQTGIVIMVNITNGKRKLNLILKSAQTNATVRREIRIRTFYLNEIYIYETVLSEFDKFQKTNGLVNGFSGVAKIYGSCDKENNECLVLENIKEIGYKIWNKKIPMNSEHVALVFTEYGKLHAISLAMNSKNPSEYKRLTERLAFSFKNEILREEPSNVRQSLMDNGVKAVEGNIFAIEAMKRFVGEVETFLNVDLETREDEIVVSHGDCWSNNMMFKYEDSRDMLKPTKVCLIDWQFSRLASPALDLAYFFFTCGSKEVLYDWERYLKIYHDSLSESLRQFSCDVETVFPFTSLEYHWKKYSKFGLYISLVIINFVLRDENEIPDMAEFIETKQDMFRNNISDVARANEYKQRIVDIVTVLAENNLI